MDPQRNCLVCLPLRFDEGMIVSLTGLWAETLGNPVAYGGVEWFPYRIRGPRWHSSLSC
jgi:hypothetical protein